MGKEALVKDLKKILGEDKVKAEDFFRELYSYDATPIPIRERKRPLCVVFPTSVEEVQEVVKFCYKNEVAMFPRGAGSGLTGGSVPTREGVVISLERLKKIKIDQRNSLAVAQAGVITKDLQDEAERFGLFYPPDPSSYKYSTVGGNLAENSGGPRCLKYGVTREYVLELEAVIKEGERIRVGNPVIKNVAGYDLTKFLVGSEGTLGIITEAVLKLIPKPKSRGTLLLYLKDVSLTGDAVVEIFSRGILPSALEFLDQNCLKLLGVDGNYGGALIVEVDGECVKEQVETLKEALKDFGKVLVAKDKTEEDKIWSLRRSLGPTLAKISSGKINEDVVVPRSELSRTLKEVEGIAKRFNLKVATFGHIGDGNLHVNFLYNKKNKDEEERAERAVEELFDFVISVGGSITGEHGVGITKREFLKKQLGEGVYNLMLEVKKIFDPKFLFNPGKLFKVSP